MYEIIYALDTQEWCLIDWLDHVTAPVLPNGQKDLSEIPKLFAGDSKEDVIENIENALQELKEDLFAELDNG